MKLPVYAELFLAVDAVCNDKSDINYGTLVDLAYKQGLEKYRPVINFLHLRGLLPPLSNSGWTDIRHLCAHKRQMDALRDKWYFPVVKDYSEQLFRIRERHIRLGWRDEKSKPRPRTIYSHVAAGAKFLDSLHIKSTEEIRGVTQASLDRFLYRHQGYREAVRGFIRYLNTSLRLFQKLRIPTLPRSLPADAYIPEAEQKLLFKKLRKARGGEARTALICALLVVYAQTPRKIAMLKLSQFERDPKQGWMASFGRIKLALDSFVVPLLERYLDERRSPTIFEQRWENPYLFPGRTRSTHVDETSIGFHLDKYGLKTRSAFSTALLNIYRHGLMRPDIVSATLGITLNTAMKYYNYVGPRQVAEGAIREEERRNADLSVRA